MRRLLTSLFSSGVAIFYLCTGIAFAETINIQNANFALDASKVVVTGKLTGFGESNHVVIEDTLTGELLAELSGVKQNFNAKIFRNPDQAVPCSVTVTSGESFASIDVKHAPPDCSNRFTLSGFVTDTVLPFATVVVHVGGQTFTTVADENGFYSLDIATATVGELVTIEATAANPNDPGETVNLINLAGTFSKLLSDPVENVTNITTAEFSLLIEANGGAVPATEEELRDAETHVDVTELLQLAAVIKLIVDDPSFTLPAGFDSIIDFIGDESAVETFIADVNTSDPGVIDDTIAAILEDSDLVEGFTVDGVPTFYFAIDRAAHGFLSPNGDGYEFDDVSQSGTFFSQQYQGRPISEAFDWGVTDGVLELSFTDLVTNIWVAYGPESVTSDPALIDLYNQCALDPGAGIVVYHRRLESSFTRVTDGSLVDIAMRTDRLETSYDEVPTIIALPDCNGDPIQFATQYQFNNVEQTLRLRADITPVPYTAGPEGVEVTGNWAMDYFYNPGEALGYPATRQVAGNLLTFNDDGTGGKLFDDQDLVDQSFTWHISGNDLVIVYPDGWTQTATILDQEGKQYGVFSEYTNGSDRFASYAIVVKQDPAFVFSEAFLVSPAGKFWNGMINSWRVGYHDPDAAWELASWWGWKFNLYPDGTNVYSYIPWETSERWWRAHQMEWNLPGDGTVQLYRWSPAYGNRYRTWIPLAQDPVTEDPVTGDPIIPVTRRFYVLEFEDFDTVRYFHPRLNIEVETDVPAYDVYEYCDFSVVCTTTP